MKSFNKVALAGELLEDMELQTSAIGNEYAKLKVATTSSGLPDSNGRRWHTVWVWNQGIISYFRHNLVKGSRLMKGACIVYHFYADTTGRKINQGQLHAMKVIDLDR